jgi:hypothetical protein
MAHRDAFTAGEWLENAVTPILAGRRPVRPAPSRSG